jgi:hypothetical protein
MQSSRTDSQKELRARKPMWVTQMTKWINVDGNKEQSIVVKLCRSRIAIQGQYFSGVAREYYGDMSNGGHVVSISQPEGHTRSPSH